MADKAKSRKGCLRGGCAAPAALLLGLYTVWTLWTGWLGPDRIETWGTGFVGQGIAEQLVLNEYPPPSAEDAAALEELLYRPIPRSLERPAVGSDDAKVAAGLRLPKELDWSVYRKYQEEFATVFSGDFVVRNCVEYHWALRFKLLAAGLWHRSSAEYVEWLASRQDILPPRRADTLIYCYTASEAGGYQNKDFFRNTNELWRGMAGARNPYYRLRALELTRHWSRDWTEERQVYLNALHERDDAFALYALRVLQTRGAADPELLEEIEHIANGRPDAGRDDAVGAAAVAALAALRDRALGDKTDKRQPSYADGAAGSTVQ